MKKQNIIEIKNLKKDYKAGSVITKALRGIDINIAKGEFTTMAGPSGSGKTTLFNLLGTIDKPTSGMVHFNGKNIHHMSKKEQSKFRREKIGFVFQSYNLIPVLTALENTEYVLMLQGVSYDERIKASKKILKEVGLKGMENKFPHQLSGGQQQRVAIARAIVSKPDLILADEPTANLDSKMTEELLDLMWDLKEKYGLTFLFATHDKTVMQKSKRLLWMKDGKITYDGKFKKGL